MGTLLGVHPTVPWHRIHVWYYQTVGGGGSSSIAYVGGLPALLLGRSTRAASSGVTTTCASCCVVTPTGLHVLLLPLLWLGSSVVCLTGELGGAASKLFTVDSAQWKLIQAGGGWGISTPLPTNAQAHSHAPWATSPKKAGSDNDRQSNGWRWSPGTQWGSENASAYGRTPIVYPIIYDRFYHHPRWLFGISSINSIITLGVQYELSKFKLELWGLKKKRNKKTSRPRVTSIHGSYEYHWIPIYE